MAAVVEGRVEGAMGDGGAGVGSVVLRREDGHGCWFYFHSFLVGLAVAASATPYLRKGCLAAAAAAAAAPLEVDLARVS